MSFQQQQSGRSKPGDAFGLVYTLASIHAAAIATLIRRDFGREALGLFPFLATILIFFTYAFTADQAMLVYLGVFLFFQVMQKARTLRLNRSGTLIHSYYQGYPYLAMQVPFVRRESTAKGFVEPMLCLIGGTLLCPVSVNLGGFVMCGFLSFMIRNGIERELRRKRLERMHDAEIEQRWLSHDRQYGIDD
jgi:hypothetical protein